MWTVLWPLSVCTLQGHTTLRNAILSIGLIKSTRSALATSKTDAWRVPAVHLSLSELLNCMIWTARIPLLPSSYDSVRTVRDRAHTLDGGIFCWDLNNWELMMSGEGENFPRVRNLRQSDMELHKSFFLKAGPWKIAYKTDTVWHYGSSNHILF